MSGSESTELLGLLAEPERLHVVAALVLGAHTTADIAAASGLTIRAAVRALGRLESGGLVDRHPSGGWAFRADRLKEVAREAAADQRPEDFGTADEPAAAVLRAFLRGGRLTAIPVQRGKRLVVLEHVARVFEVGVRYPEREVNALLRVFFDDVAALRRYLVDEGILSRENREYWRTGGTVDV